MTPLDWLVPMLRCPVCLGSLSFRADQEEDGLLVHFEGACEERYPVIVGVPRVLLGEHRSWLANARAEWFGRTAERRTLGTTWGADQASAPSLVAGFDDEWSRYASVGSDEHARVFELYVDQLDASAFDAGAVVLDAGCGAGRWTYEIARRGPRVVAVDLGLSVERAAANNRGSGRVACLQADLHELPLAEASVDWGCSLGVLHHLARPQRALAHVTRAVRPGGQVLLYLYYALDGRGSLFRGLFLVVDRIRRITSAAPRPLLRAIAGVVAAIVYWPLARAARTLATLGRAELAEGLPLSFYRDRSFRTMRNDSLDRFGTAVERRYTREQVTELMTAAGLDRIVVSPRPPFWHAIGRRPR